MDGNTDSSSGTRAHLCLFLDSKRTLTAKLLSIKKVKLHTHADGFKASILEAFERLKLAIWEIKLFTLSVNGASVNTGIH